MKKILLTALLGGTALFTMAQALPEKQFDRAHTLDLLVVYDDTEWQYAENFENARETFAQEVVKSLNQVMENSNIDYRYRVAGTYHWAGYKAPSIDTGLNDATWNEGIRNQRQKTKADIVLFVTENQDSNSGAANAAAKFSDAFACVRRSMAASAFTAAHEIGHILGANHSDQAGEYQPSAHPWAKAYVSPEGYRTVVSSGGAALPIYSGPESVWITDKGDRIIMGDATHDNVRMIKSMLPAAVNFGEYTDPSRAYASTERMVFNNQSQAAELTVYCNNFTLISTEGAWISSLTPSFSSSQDKVTFQISANTTASDRHGAIILDTDGKKQRIEIVQTAADVNLDGNGGTYVRNATNYYEHVQLMRNFSNTDWQTLYLPLQWRYEDWKDCFEIAKLKSVTAVGENEAELRIVPLTSGATKENTPYLIRAKKADDYVLNLKHYSLFPAVENATVLTTSNRNFTFTGTYKGVAGQDMFNKGYYGMAKGVIAPTDHVEAQLKAFRWYLNITDDNGQPLNKPMLIKVVTQDDDATAIEETAVERRTFDIYDLNGRIVRKNARDTDNLDAGVYIINGKKMIQ